MSLVDHLLDLRDAVFVAGGLAYYKLKGTTPLRSYHGMVRLFCRTGGRLNDLLSRGIARLRPPAALPRRRGVLGELGDARLDDIRVQLERDGYYVFPERLDDAICDRLLALALRIPSTYYVPGEGDAPRTGVYERAAPRAVRHEFSQAQLIEDEDVQELMADESILAVAQAYVGSLPVLDIVAMWWHTAFQDAPDARAAQYYHFDMDRPRWLKFFIYLTDVEEDTGPHRFIRGSHRTGAVPKRLLDRGYARLTDEEVAREFPESAHVCFTGKRGTIIAEDTRGLHKGQHVRRGDRLVLQLEFANSLFGGSYARHPIEEVKSEALAARRRAYPDVYAVFSS